MPVQILGLNEAPFTNTTQEITLTETVTTYTLELSATEFGNANSRVLFDLGADVGVVILDNVSLELASPPPPPTGNLLVNGDFEDGTTGWIGNALSSNLLEKISVEVALASAFLSLAFGNAI